VVHPGATFSQFNNMPPLAADVVKHSLMKELCFYRTLRIAAM
jgi:hypothetical protein